MNNSNQFEKSKVAYSCNPMDIKDALKLLYDGNLYDRKGDLTWQGYRALEALEGVKLTEITNG